MQIKKQLKTELKSQQETQKSDTVQTVTFRDKRYQAKTQVSNDSLNLKGIVRSLKLQIFCSAIEYLLNVFY